MFSFKPGATVDILGSDPVSFIQTWVQVLLGFIQTWVQVMLVLFRPGFRSYSFYSDLGSGHVRFIQTWVQVLFVLFRPGFRSC